MTDHRSSADAAGPGETRVGTLALPASAPAELVDLLLIAAGPTAAEEVADEPAAVAAFVAARADVGWTPAPGVPTPRARTRMSRHSIRVAAAATVSCLVLGGGLAAADVLPAPAQRWVSAALDKIGISVPTPVSSSPESAGTGRDGPGAGEFEGAGALPDGRYVPVVSRVDPGSDRDQGAPTDLPRVPDAGPVPGAEPTASPSAAPTATTNAPSRSTLPSSTGAPSRKPSQPADGQPGGQTSGQSGSPAEDRSDAGTSNKRTNGSNSASPQKSSSADRRQTPPPGLVVRSGPPAGAPGLDVVLPNGRNGDPAANRRAG